MAGAFSLPEDYWSKLQITRQDVKSLNTYLFEAETPLTANLTSVFVTTRIQAEQQARAAQRQAGGKTYKPAEKYQAGDELVFPAHRLEEGEGDGYTGGKSTLRWPHLMSSQ